MPHTMKDRTDEEMISYEAASKVTGLKLSTLYSKVSKKEIPHYRFGPRLVMFDYEELVDWMRTRRVEVRP